MRRYALPAVLLMAIASVGCTTFVGEYDGTAELAVRREPTMRGDAKKFPVHVSIRSGQAPAHAYPQGKLVLEVTGEPFTRCAMNVYDSSQRLKALNVSHEGSCSVAVDGYAGELPGRTLVAFVDGDEVSASINDAPLEASTGAFTVRLHLRGRRAR
jgi:hypothetical protein